MNRKYFRYGSIIAALTVVLLLSGCPSPLSYTGGSDDVTPSATVSVDPLRGVAVLTEEDGSETVIGSAENGEFVNCIEVTDYIIVDESGAGRYARSGRHLRAVVLGVRSDGRPGVWMVYSGGIVVVPEGDSGDVTSELLEAASEGDGFRWDDGWSYDAAAISDDFRVIVGTAKNPDALWIADQLGTIPQVVVWWNLYEKDDGRFFLSRARAVAEYPEWNLDEVKSNRHRDIRMRHIIRWLRWLFDRLGLWFFAWADDFLGDLAGEDVLGDLKPVETVGDGTYGIFGYDKEGDFARASITQRMVLDIEKTDPPIDPNENLPPWPVTGPTTLFGYVKVYETQPWIQLEVGGSTDPADFDPDDGDTVTFEIASISTKNSDSTIDQYIQENVLISNDGILSIVWDNMLIDVEVSFVISTDDGKVDTPTLPDEDIVILFEQTQ